jgi:hypothetical protein
MRRRKNSVTAGFLVAGCGGGVSSAVRSVAPGKRISVPGIALGTGPGSPTASGGAGSSLTWLWVLIGAAVIIGVIALVLIARYVGRRPTIVAGWLSRAVDAHAQGSALHDAMSIAARPDALTAEDSGERWADIQQRADDFARTLHALRAAAAEDDDRTRVTDVLGSLQAVRTTMDALRAPGGAAAGQGKVVRDRLTAFERSLRELRPADHRLP